MDSAAKIEEFEGYKCLLLSGSNIGFSTTSAENARLVPWGATITNSVDVYATAECDIKLGFSSKPNNIHVSELNKWVRVSITQELDEGNPSFFYIMGGSGSGSANVHVKEAKCEEGTASTPWEPSVNDIVVISEKVDTNFEVTQGLIKSEINSVKVMGTGSENIVKEGNYGIEGDAGNPGFIELYKSLVKGNTYTAVLSGELAEGYKFQLCDSGQWEIQGEFENVGGRITRSRPRWSITRFTSVSSRRAAIRGIWTGFASTRAT